jgi:hypothetical protein
MHIKSPIVMHGLVAAGVITTAAIASRPAATPMPASAQPEIVENMDMAAAVEAWRATMNPGPAHEFLEQFVGEWNTKTSIYMDPTTPMVSTGTAVGKLILGGRYIRTEHQGEMLLPSDDGSMQPVPMSGIAITGYNVGRKQYTSVWLDTMSTAMLTSTGSLDQSGTVLTMFGEMDEPMTGEVGKTVKYVTRVISENEYTFEIHEVLYGKPFKVVEVHYKRK